MCMPKSQSCGIDAADCRRIRLVPCKENLSNIPGISLQRDPVSKMKACKIKFSATYVDRKEPCNNYTDGNCPPADTFASIQ